MRLFQATNVPKGVTGEMALKVMTAVRVRTVKLLTKYRMYLTPKERHSREGKAKCRCHYKRREHYVAVSPPSSTLMTPHAHPPLSGAPNFNLTCGVGVGGVGGACPCRVAGKYPIISEHIGDTSPSQQDYIQAHMAGLGYFRYFEFFDPQQSYIVSPHPALPFL